jgi:hypothetical protein
MPPLPAAPAHWLALAAEARSLAEQATDEFVRQTMLMVARDCDALAKQAARVRPPDAPIDGDEDVGPSPD